MKNLNLTSQELEILTSATESALGSINRLIWKKEDIVNKSKGGERRCHALKAIKSLTPEANEIESLLNKLKAL